MGENTTTTATGRTELHNAALGAIEATLPRLRRLGCTIRQVCYGRMEIKAQQFASLRLDVKRFTDVSHAIVHTLYPNAHPSLLKYLAKTMANKYVTMEYSIYRSERLQARRPVAPLSTLPLINESTTVTPSPAAIPAKPSAPAPSVRMYGTVIQSDLSTIDSKHPRLQALRSPNFLDGSSERGRRGTSSVQISKGLYPPFPLQRDSNLPRCEWCGVMIDKQKMSESDWRHVLAQSH